MGDAEDWFESTKTENFPVFLVCAGYPGQAGHIPAVVLKKHRNNHTYKDWQK